MHTVYFVFILKRACGQVNIRCPTSGFNEARYSADPQLRIGRGLQVLGGKPNAGDTEPGLRVFEISNAQRPGLIRVSRSASALNLLSCRRLENTQTDVRKFLARIGRNVNCSWKSKLQTFQVAPNQDAEKSPWQFFHIGFSNVQQTSDTLVVV